jgi:hypothetical protein
MLPPGEERARHRALASSPPADNVARELQDAALEAARRGAPAPAAERAELAYRFTASDRPHTALGGCCQPWTSRIRRATSSGHASWSAKPSPKTSAGLIWPRSCCRPPGSSPRSTPSSRGRGLPWIVLATTCGFVPDHFTPRQSVMECGVVEGRLRQHDPSSPGRAADRRSFPHC